MGRRLATLVGLGLSCVAGQAWAADIPADPSNYQQLLSTLQPGDVLQLAPGQYPRLTIDGLHGTADAIITIEGPADGESAVITSDACCNTVQIREASFVAIRNLTVDAQGLSVDPINAKDAPSHDILIENNTLIGFPEGSQQIVGINTKVTVWNWTIRGNRIVEPGTGLYLGNSDGGTPFVNGVIENNVVEYPTGYCMQIKHQNSYSAMDDMPPGPNRTIIRGNVFLKDDRNSPDGDRPNLLIGGFPDDGYGADDMYEIYGNVLIGNPREAQLQATGSFSVHDNLFIGVGDDRTALVVTEHQGKAVRVAHVYNNTVYGGMRGIRFAAGALQSDAVVGNLVFSGEPISGTIGDARDNLVDAIAAAGDYVGAPSVDPATMDFFPLAGAVQGAAADLSVFSGDVAADRDFNGTDKGDVTFRGAYAGEGNNPGCSVAELIEDPAGCTPVVGDDDDDDDDDSVDGTAGGDDDDDDDDDDAPTSGGDSADPTSGDGTSAAADGGDSTGGCDCRSSERTSGWAWALLLMPLLRRRAAGSRDGQALPACVDTVRG